MIGVLASHANVLGLIPDFVSAGVDVCVTHESSAM